MSRPRKYPNVETGTRFGKLTVIKKEFVKKVSNQKYRYVELICDCGNLTTVLVGDLYTQKTKSCGCLISITSKQLSYKHGKIKTKTYRIWSGIIQRCTNPDDKAYKHYGKRGITVCDSWLNFQNFIKDMGECPPNLSIERIDNNAGYNPKNCKWVTRKEQQNNTRRNRFVTFNGATKTIAQWAEEYNIEPNTLNGRIKLGWSIDKALMTPTQKHKNTNRF